MASLLVGIAGGSGSGKTTLSVAVAEALGPGQAVVIPHDAYYRDLSHLPFAERSRCNFDEPSALENDRLVEDMLSLSKGRGIARPNYDFATHTRMRATTWMAPCPVVIIEGILVLATSALREIFDIKVFVDTAEEERLKRRIERDMRERGRTHASVEAQFLGITRPMHAIYVEPSRQHGDVVVSGEQDLHCAVASVVFRIRELRG